MKKSIKYTVVIHSILQRPEMDFHKYALLERIRYFCSRGKEWSFESRINQAKFLKLGERQTKRKISELVGSKLLIRGIGTQLKPSQRWYDLLEAGDDFVDDVGVTDLTPQGDTDDTQGVTDLTRKSDTDDTQVLQSMEEEEEQDSMPSNSKTNNSEEDGVNLEVENKKDKCIQVVNANMGKKTKGGVKRRQHTLEHLPDGLDIPEAVKMFAHYYVVLKGREPKFNNSILGSFDMYMEGIEDDWNIKKEGETIVKPVVGSKKSKSDIMHSIFIELCREDLVESDVRIINELTVKGMQELTFAAMCIYFKSYSGEDLFRDLVVKWFNRYKGNKLIQSTDWKNETDEAKQFLESRK